MSGFATIADPSAPVRVVLVGAGEMGRSWLTVLEDSADVDVVGLVDLDLGSAGMALEGIGRDDVSIGVSAVDVAVSTRADAVVNVTVPSAHRAVTVDALMAGLPVLCEKPIAPALSEALSLAAASEVTGQLLMTSQSRRYYDSLAETKRLLPALGEIGIVKTEYFMAPEFGGFRESMDYPLLIDMAIHAFDVARYLLDADPISVHCESFNPPWSWYAGDAVCNASFEFENGARFFYTGSWCSPGFETSWNGTWRLTGSKGTVIWDGESRPKIDAKDEPPRNGEPTHAGEAIAGSLAEFIDSLRTGRVPSGEVHSNILSLAMVEGAVASARSGRRENLAELLADGYRLALETEPAGDLRARLESWSRRTDSLVAYLGSHRRVS